LDDLASAAHDLGCHKNEEQGVRVEYERRVERAEEAREGDARREPGANGQHRTHVTAQIQGHAHENHIREHHQQEEQTRLIERAGIEAGVGLELVRAGVGAGICVERQDSNEHDRHYRGHDCATAAAPWSEEAELAPQARQQADHRGRNEEGSGGRAADRRRYDVTPDQVAQGAGQRTRERAAQHAHQDRAYRVQVYRELEALLDRGIKAEHDCVLRYFLDKRALWLNEEIVAFGRGGALIYSTEKALRQIGRRNPDVLGGNGLAVLKDIAPALWSSRLATLLPGASIEVVTQDGQEVGGVLVLHDVRRTRAAPGALAVEGTERLHFDAILGESHAIREAREKALRMAQSGTPVLLEGETGVGKELFARAIHGAREPSGPFVPVNCGGLPRDLVASEIFGYEKGAFTGADAAGRPGKVEAADGGLLCLDEIGEMPLDLQSYLLRVLEDGVVYRVGSHEGRRVNLRLVSMTNRDLPDEMAAGRFRKDLYYRIATLRLHIPPLRERGDDIVILLEHFAQAAAQRAGREAPRLTAAALDALRAYHWPGNVRELRNVVETLVVLSPGGPIGPEELPAEVRGPRTSQVAPSAGSTDLRSVEQATIAAAVRACGGNLSNAAKYLGIARSTLYVRMAEFELMSPVSQAESNRESRLRKLDVGITSARRGSPYALMSDFKGEGAFTIRPLRCPNWIGAQGTRSFKRAKTDALHALGSRCIGIFGAAGIEQVVDL